jgi:hypothetical protein
MLGAVQVSRLMGMGPDEDVTGQIAAKLEDMLQVVRKVRGPRGGGWQVLVEAHQYPQQAAPCTAGWPRRLCSQGLLQQCTY